MKSHALFALLMMVAFVSWPACDCGGPPNEGEGEGDEGEGEEGEGEGEEGEGEEGEGEEGEGEAGEGEGEAPIGAYCFDGWCFENPRPHTLDIDALAVIAPDDVWTAGATFGFMHWDGATFTHFPFPSGAVPDFQGVRYLWASSPTELWAAGNVLYHFENGAWSVDDTVEPGVVAIWGAAPDDLYAVTSLRVLHYDGNAWSTAFEQQGFFLSALSGSASDDVWAFGRNGTAHFDGDAWTVVAGYDGITTAQVFPVDAWVGAPNDIWMISDADLFGPWHFNGATWQQFIVPDPFPLMKSITAPPGALSSSGDVWLVTSSDAFRFDPQQGAWVLAQAFDTFANIAQVRATAPNNVWVVADDGLFQRFDGEAWSAPGLFSSTDVFLEHLVVANDGAVIAVGETPVGGDAVVFRSDDGLWLQDETTPRIDDPDDLAASSRNDVWFSEDDFIYHFNGITWTTMERPQNAEIIDICALAPNDAYMVIQVGGGPDDFAEVLHWDGSAWNPDSQLPAIFAFSGSGDVRTQLFCNAPNDIWVGGGGLIMQRTGPGTWERTGMFSWNSAVPSSSNGALRAVSVGDEIWTLVAPAGEVGWFDGIDWRPIDAAAIAGQDPFDFELFDVHGSQPNDVWLVGDAALHWNGAVLSDTSIDTGSFRPFANVWSFAPGNAFLIVEDTTVLHVQGTTTTTIFNGPIDPIDEEPVYFLNRSDVWFDSPSFGFVIGALDTFRWTGSELVVETGLPQFFSPRAVWGFSPTDVWLVGGSNLELAHWNGLEWTGTEIDVLGSDEFIDVFGASPDDVWALTQNGVLYRNQNGAGFVAVEPTIAVGGGVITGVAVNDVRFFGGGAARFNGTDFENIETLDHPVRIQRVGASLFAADMFAGTWERTAAGWTRLAPDLRETSDSSFFDLAIDAAFVSATEAYFISDRNRLMFIDDTTDSVVEHPLLGDLFNLTAVDSRDGHVFVIGGRGIAAHKLP